MKDINEFLDELGPIPPTGRINAVATYHDACHLAHAQKITAAPRRLLSMIPGLELRDLPESAICCGSAGTYNLNEAEMSDRLARAEDRQYPEHRRPDRLASNAGCLLQIQREVRQRKLPLLVMHPMDLLELSYREQSRDSRRLCFSITQRSPVDHSRGKARPANARYAEA